MSYNGITKTVSGVKPPEASKPKKAVKKKQTKKVKK